MQLYPPLSFCQEIYLKIFSFCISFTFGFLTRKFLPQVFFYLLNHSGFFTKILPVLS